MKIVVAVKVVPDDQDIFVSPDRSLDYSKAKPKISEYDKNALEAAAQFAAANDGSQVIAISAVPAKNDDTKAKQNILALGVDELFMATDDALETADSYATAQVLKNIVETKVPDYDVIICGDGSADLYAGQVNIQSLLHSAFLPSTRSPRSLLRATSSLSSARSMRKSKRSRSRLPAVVSVSPDIATPRIAGMRDILAAKKKPQTVEAAAVPVDVKVDVEEIKAPELAPRKNQIFEEGDIDAFVAAVAEALK